MFQNSFFADLKAGIVLFLIALPLCFGIAFACNVPLFSGIIGGIIGGILVTIFSGSKYSVSSPAAALTTLVISSIAQLGSFELFLAATIAAGFIQIVLGFIKAGSIGSFIPNAVIKGMLAGIGLVLIIKQIPHLFGYDKNPLGAEQFIQIDGENTFTDLIKMVNFITPGCLIIGLVSLCILIITEKSFYKRHKFLSNMPGPLIVVVCGILLSKLFVGHSFFELDTFQLLNLPVILNLNDLLSNLTFPNFSKINTSVFWIISITLAFVASLETLIAIEAFDKIDPNKNKSNSNKELVAVGIGNVASGLIGGLPLSSVVVRSSANINAGAKSKLSIIIHAVLLLVCVLFLPNLLASIPNACLAAILIFTGFKLTNFSIIKQQWHYGWDQFLPFVITIAIILFKDLLWGISIGIIVSIIFIIRDNVKFSFDITECLINNKKNYLIKLPQHVTFFNKGFLIKFFKTVEPNSHVLIDCSINKKMNRDSKDVIGDFILNAHLKHITTELVNAKK